MRRNAFLLITLLFALAATRANAQAPNTITTVAGGGTNSGAANTWTLTQPPKAIRDAAGNTYFSDPILCVIYKVTPAGALSIYAGNGTFGVGGDGGPATSAGLDFPVGVALDANGNLFIADFNNNRIRRVDVTTHIITTVAGSEDPFIGGYTGDGGLATLARLNTPYAVAVDSNGNIFISDSGNNVIRRVDANTQVITTYAGNGLPGTPGQPNGDGGQAVNAQFNMPIGIVVDGSDNLYIADSNDSVIRRVDGTTKIITSYAGSPATQNTFGGDGGPAASAGLKNPADIFLDSVGNLYIADTGNDRIRKADNSATHVINTVAGGIPVCFSPASACGDGGAATSAALNHPTGVFLDGSNNLLIADYGDQRIRIVTGGNIAAFAGGASGGDGGAATSAILGLPNSMAVDGSGNLFIVEQYGDRIRKVDGATHKISAFAGTGSRGERMGTNGNGGPATSGTFIDPFGIALDAQGNFYVVDFMGAVVRKIDTTGTISTVVGNGLRCGEAGNPNTNGNNCGDGGAATSASLLQPVGIAVDTLGNLYISDVALNRIRKVDANGDISNFAGTGQTGNSGDGEEAILATLNQPFGMAVDAQQNLYFADSGNNVIRKIDSTNTISTYAFNGFPGFLGDGGSALEASMTTPQQVALDNKGNLYIGGGIDNVVRRVDAQDQSIITVAGDIENLGGGFSGDGGPSVKALIGNLGSTLDASHNLYIADGLQRVRKVNLLPITTESGTFTAFPPTLNGTLAFNGPDQAISFSNSGLDDLILTVTSPLQTSAFQIQFGTCALPCVVVVPPGESGTIDVAFAPLAGGPTGTINGTLALTTNDPANPSFSFPLSGTATNTPETLTVTVTPNADGFVFSTPIGISCGVSPAQVCSASFAQNSQVTLTATPSGSGFTFTGWSGAGCSGTADCVVTMTQAQNVTATFTTGTPPPPGATVVSAIGNGSGTITSNPAGINCAYSGTATSGTCSFTFAPNILITLTATPSATVPNSTFAGWLGVCSSLGTNTCQTFTGFGFTTTAVFSGPRQAFTQGEIFAGAAGGMIFVYKPDGTLAQILGSGNLGGNIGGIAFDTSGNLYAANPSAITGNITGTVERFGSNGAGPTTFGTGPAGNGYDATPESVVVAPTGEVYVAQQSGRQSLLKFAAAGGAATAEYFPPQDTGAMLWIELLDDNSTMLYTTAGNIVKAFDVHDNIFLPDFAQNLPGPAALGLRELPDKTVLLATGTAIVQLNTSGTVINTYQSGTGVFHSLNIDPDGVSFWTLEDINGTMLHISVANGAIIKQFSTGVTSSLSAFNGFEGGLAVFGQPQSGGADMQVTMSAAPSPALQNSNLTYTIVVKNNGALSAANVAMTDAFPAGVNFVSSSSTVGTCSGTTTVTCNLGTMTNGSNATITIVVKPTNTGALVNTVNVTSTTPDPVTSDNSATTSTTVSGPAATHFSVTAPANATSGTQFNFTVTALDASNATVTGYLGTVRFTSSDGAAMLPSNSALVNGVGTFPAVLGSAGAQTITATDTVTASITGTSGTIAVAAATFPLTVAAAGSGTGTVTGNGINCGNGAMTCSVNLAAGTAVTLTQGATNGSTFSGWNGTPTACTVSGFTCTFSMPSNTENVTATFAAGTGIVFTSILPPGALGVPYGADIRVSGGTPPYTFSVANGSTLPAGFTLAPTANGNVAAGHIFGNSPAVSNTFTFGIKVTDSSPAAPQSATATISLTIGAAPPNTQAGLLKGPYAILIRDFGDNGKMEADAGSLNFDGVNKLTGVVDANVSGGLQSNVPVTGTYSIGPDNRGFVNIASANGTIALAISVGGVYRGVATSARVTEFSNDDSNARLGSGYMFQQDPTAFTPASVAGTYVFGITGQDPSLARAGTLGLVTLDANLNITSGSADVNIGGATGSVTSIVGNYTAPDANGRMPFNVTVTPGGAFTRVAYVISQTQFVLLTTDTAATNILYIGTAMRQLNPGTFSNSSITGPAVLTLDGLSNGGDGFDSIVGLATVATGNLSLAFDENSAGALVLGQTLSGALTVLPTGRASVPLGAQTVMIYLASPNRGFSLGTGPGVVAGALYPQVGAPFSASPLAGNLFLGVQEALAPAGSQFSGIGVVTAPANTNVTTDESRFDSDLFFNQNIGAYNFAVASNGHMTVPAGQPNGGVSGYLISPWQFAVLDTNGPASDPTPTVDPNIIVAATLIAPAGQPSPAATAVNFPTPVAAGSNAQSTPITITNIGLGPLGFTGQNTGNSPDFSGSGTCLASALVVVQPGGSCTLIVTFAPTANTATGVLLTESLLLTTDGGNVTITATGTAAAAAGAAVRFIVAAPGAATSSAQFSFTVTAKDAANNTATGYTGTVHFTSSDGAALLPVNMTLTNGVGTFQATLNTVGNQTITATDTVTASITGVSGAITVTGAGLTPMLAISKTHVGNFTQGQQGAQYTVTVSNAQTGAPTSGTSSTTVQSTGSIFDTGGGSTPPTMITLLSGATSVVFTGVTGSITTGCASTEGCIVLNNGTGNNANDPDGVGAAPVTSSNTGTGSISGITGPGAGYLVGVFVPAGGPVGTAPAALDFTSTGLGTSFTSLSPQLDQVFFIGDGLTGNGTGTLQTFNIPTGAAQLWVGISDAGFYNGAPGAYGDNLGFYTVDFTVNAPSSGGAMVTETPSAGLTLVSMAGMGWTCGSPNSANICTRSDALAAGAAYPVITVSVNVAADATSPQVNTASVTGGGSAQANTSDSTVIVSASAAATHFVVSAPGAATSAAQFSFTVTAKDAANNTATGYAGMVHFTSSDGAAALPVNMTLTNGVGTFQATLNTVGNQTITTTDTITASITGTSGAINVTAVAAPLLTVQTAGTGTGTVTGAGINCTSGSANGCTTNVTAGTQVTLTEEFGANSTFTSWSAPCPNTTGTSCTFAMPAVATMVIVTFTVNAPTLKSIAVTPANPTVPINSTQQFTATGTFSDNSTKDITATATWASSNTDAATINT
ncbi:MAG: InlB B-repeat-containing protein, partial [Candidatus Acidiferrales bacterium]